MITSVIPKLPYIVKQQTIDFYVQLGFALQADYGDYVIMKDAQVVLHFFTYPTLQPARSDFMIYFTVDAAIEKLYQQVQNNGIAIHPNGKLEDKAWRQREFSILDPNGTLLTFGQSL